MPKIKLTGNIEVPGDKSISHRALIFAAFSRGISHINNLSPAADCASTIDCLSKLGLRFSNDSQSLSVQSAGVSDLISPQDVLFVGNSGTTIRLLSGLLAGVPFKAQLDGDASLRKRPMARVLDHLQTMGAQIEYGNGSGMAPFTISGGNLIGKEFVLIVASAQVQTAILLAGLQANGTTSVCLPRTVRDHTQRMFAFLGIPFQKQGEYTISVKALEKTINPFQYHVMGDISSAAFFMVAAACLPGSDLTLLNVGLNPGRTLVIDVLSNMGAQIEITNEREQSNELVADIKIKGGKRLQGTSIIAEDIPRGVDEIPVLAVAGALCEGEFSVTGAQELRHKESDRLQLIVANLKAAGAQVKELEDGFVITGKKNIAGGSPWQTELDHRMSMTGLVANILFDNELDIEETESLAVSYPEFVNDLNSLVVS